MTLALALAAIFLSCAMAGAWVIQRATGNSGWIDMIWTFAVGLGAWLALWFISAPPARLLLLASLVAIWSLRLGLHIFARTRRSDDDPRYAKLMTEWGAAAPLRLFLFLQVQALAGWVLVLAVILAAACTDQVNTAGTWIFALLALISVVGEGLADRQLAACKRNKPPSGICETGLWAYSRHPNYFFEWLFWVAIASLAVAPPHGLTCFAALAAPVMMYALLRHASGVPHLEAHMQRTRPQAFAEYARRVPVFFPRLWP